MANQGAGEQRTAGPTVSPAGPATGNQGEYTAPEPEEVDCIVAAAIAAVLREFNHIPIEVMCNPSAPAGSRVRVVTHAVYFINTPAARTNYAIARNQDYLNQGVNEFGAIVEALRRHQSLLEPGHEDRRYSAGRSVEVGKATPGDIKRFVEQALKLGVIERRARRRGELLAGQQLTDLSPPTLKAVIQEWIADTGIGVDCSGFVLQAAIRAREAVRREAAARGVAVPPHIGHKERSAAAFAGGAAVSTPRDLRPGDAWVLGEEHVRIVSSVRTVRHHVRFQTAESSGSCTQSSPGLVARTWRTSDLDNLHPITLIAGPAPSGAWGTFHRINQ